LRTGNDDQKASLPYDQSRCFVPGASAAEARVRVVNSHLIADVKDIVSPCLMKESWIRILSKYKVNYRYAS